MATQDQALVSSVLDELRLEYQEPSPPGMVGGESEYKVTAATLAFLNGKTVTVHPDGSITVR